MDDLPWYVQLLGLVFIGLMLFAMVMSARAEMALSAQRRRIARQLAEEYPVVKAMGIFDWRR